MKKIFLLIYFLPILVNAQLHPIKKMILQEYWIGAIGADGILYAWGSFVQNSSAHPLPGGRTIIDAGALFNAFTAVANDGTFWYSNAYNNNGMSTWIQVPTDTTGTGISNAAGNGAIACWGFEDQYFIERADSSIWTGGIDDLQIFSTNTTTMRPIKMTQTGQKIRSLRVAGGKLGILAVSSDSLTIFNWAAASGATPGTLTTTIGAHRFLDADGDGGNQYNYIGLYLVQMTTGSSYGHPCVIGNNCSLYGGASGCSTNHATLTDIYTTLGFTSLIKEIGCNAFGAFLVDSLHNLWNMGGSNVQGQVGIGNETVNKYTYNSFPAYSWDFVVPESQVYGKVQVGSSIQWNHISTDKFFVFYMYGRDLNDSLYAWGRGKQNILAQPYQMQANDYANHPNCCDLLVPTQVHNAQTNVPTYAWTGPSWTAGSNFSVVGTTTSLTASGAPPKIVRLVSPFDTIQYTINNVSWTCTSKPSGAANPTFGNANAVTTTVSGLVTGSYTFQNIETDNNTGTNAASVTVTVSAAPSCNCIPPPLKAIQK